VSHPSGKGGDRPQSSTPQNTVFRRPCFQIAVHPSGDGAQLGVRVVAAPAGRR
jgi:hypothetical protein